MAFKKACCCYDLAAGTQIIGISCITTVILYLLVILNGNYNIHKEEFPTAQVIYGVIELTICGFLIAGARQKNIYLIFPWLLLNLIGLILFNVLFIVENGVAFAFIQFLVMIDLIGGYLWLNVLSLYIDIGW